LCSTAPGSGGTGDSTAAQDLKTWSCLSPESALSKTCLTTFKDFANAVTDPERCSSPGNNGTPGCVMLADLKSFVEQNPDLLLDMLQFVLMTCGLIPGIGEGCDAIDAAVSFKRGDWVGGLLSMGSTIPIAGYLATGAKGWKNSDKLRKIKEIVEQLTKACKRSSSFVRGTRVLLADGREEPIESVQTGEAVLATDPATGTTAAKPVVATMTKTGNRMLADITVDTDGNRGDKTATITATANHPFWVPGLGVWVKAGSLTAGTAVRGVDGANLDVLAVRHRTVPASVHNLTVADFHTYYVVAGDRSLLVHNAPPQACRITSSPGSPKIMSQTVWTDTNRTMRIDVENPNPGVEGAAGFHVQFMGNGADPKKYYYNGSDGTWVTEAGDVLPAKVAKKIPASAINKARQYLGL
jgi:hypothetical protein